MHEVDPARLRDVAEVDARPPVRHTARGATIEHHHRGDGAHEREDHHQTTHGVNDIRPGEGALASLPMSRVSFCAIGIILLLGCHQQQQSPADAGAILTARTLGLAYVEDNRLEEASNEFVKLIRLAPEEPSGYANLGLVYLRLGRYAAAQREIDRAVKLAPDDPDIRLLQATAQRLGGDSNAARRTLEASLQQSPQHLKTLYALQAWGRLVEAAPANVAARLAYAEALLDSGKVVEARDQLELLRQRLPSLPTQAQRAFGVAVANPAPASLARAQAVLETTPVYQASLAELRGPAGTPPGYPILTFSARLALTQQDPRVVVNAIRFTEVTAPAGIVATALGVPGFGTGLVARPVPAAVGDYDNDGHLDVFAAGRLYRNNGDGSFTQQTIAPGATHAVFGDFDGDPRIDLIVENNGTLTLYRGLEEGHFEAHPLPVHATTIA